MDTNQGQSEQEQPPSLRAASKTASEQYAKSSSDSDLSLQMIYGKTIAQLSTQHPAWFAKVFEDGNPFVASEQELLLMIQQTPDEMCRSVLVGIMMMREHIAAVTGQRYIRPIQH